MTKIFYFVLFLLPLISIFSYAQNSGQDQPIALVWGDKGACKEGCITSLKELAEKAGFATIIVTRENFSAELLDKAALWVQPGGNAITVSRIMKGEIRKLIRDFVYNGGGYLGICAGAFLADKWVNDKNSIPGLGITPVVTADHGKTKAEKKSQILDVLWGNSMRKIYFSGGATIKTDSPGLDQVNIFAHYIRGYNFKPAAWENSYGSGFVVLSGPHPEAPEFWKKHLKEKDSDGDDSDLAMELFERAYHSAQLRMN